MGISGAHPRNGRSFKPQFDHPPHRSSVVSKKMVGNRSLKKKTMVFPLARMTNKTGTESQIRDCQKLGQTKKTQLPF